MDLYENTAFPEDSFIRLSPVTCSKGAVAPTFSALKGGLTLQAASWKVARYRGVSQLHCHLSRYNGPLGFVNGKSCVTWRLERGTQNTWMLRQKAKHGKAAQEHEIMASLLVGIPWGTGANPTSALCWAPAKDGHKLRKTPGLEWRPLTDHTKLCCSAELGCGSSCRRPNSVPTFCFSSLELFAWTKQVSRRE